jgi:MoxR-like ATPase
MSEDLVGLATSVRALIDTASRGLVGRRSLVELVVLGAVAREHVLVIGPPGTAKSQAVRQVAEAVGDRYFEYLIGRFTEPNELFGPIDLVELRQGRVVVDTRDMLPEAEIAFLDEVFLGSSAILNTLLGILNERVFRRGHTVRQCPLRICVGASNELPTDLDLAAFADRFLIRVFVEPMPDPHLDELLEVGWQASRPLLPVTGERKGGVLEVAAADVDRVDVAAVRPAIAQCIRTLRRHDITLSDRRAVRAQRLVAAAAVLDGRTTATDADLWALLPAVPTHLAQQRATDVLGPLLERSRSGVAGTAAEEASRGLLATAERIVRTHVEYLGLPVGEDRMLRMEGLAREIDATFPPGALPVAIVAVRAALVDEL